MNCTAIRIPTSVVRQRFSNVLEQAQDNEVHIVHGSVEKGKPVAVLVSHDRFNALTRRAEVGESALRQLDQEAALQMKTHRNDPALRAMQDKIRAALASLRPTPRYSLKELLARVPAEGLPIDRGFDAAPPVGREPL